MNRITVSIGSNIDRERHVQICLDALQARFGQLSVSRVFESEPVGFEDGRNFYNLVAAFHSRLDIGELQAWCRALEYANGRHRHSPKFSPRTLDIDLLTVGDFVGMQSGVELPRDEIDKNAFVLRPLAELLPEQRHPASGRRYTDLWVEFSTSERAQRQALWPVDFIWQGKTISRAA